MRRVKRWLVLVLAVILIGASTLYQLGTFMSADELDEPEPVKTETFEEKSDQYVTIIDNSGDAQGAAVEQGE